MNNITHKIISIFMLLLFLQVFMLGTKQLLFRFISETFYSRSIITMILMIIMLTALNLYYKPKYINFLFMPNRFSLKYAIITIITLCFYVITFKIEKIYTLEKIFIIFYGSIITPLFEEILFRGIIWNELNKYYKKEIYTYITVTILFALWHIGYAIGIYFWQGGNLINCICMKVLFGGIYGTILGGIKYKSKNCYIGFLLHGILNLFG